MANGTLHILWAQGNLRGRLRALRTVTHSCVPVAYKLRTSCAPVVHRLRTLARSLLRIRGYLRTVMRPYFMIITRLRIPVILLGVPGYY
jgi:hypothetical protein